MSRNRIDKLNGMVAWIATKFTAPMAIPMKPVRSSQIAKVGYDESKRTLAIQFKSGGTYHYANVSPELHGALVTAPSIGSYFHKYIKPRPKAHPYVKVS